MEDEKTLKSSALVRQLSDSVQNQVDNLLTCKKISGKYNQQNWLLVEAIIFKIKGFFLDKIKLKKYW